MKKMFLGFAIIISNLLYSQINNSPKLVNFIPSECDKETEVYRLRTRIIDKWYNNDTLKIEVGTSATCCVDFVPSIEFKNDTLNLIFIETGEACECMCCYQFIYSIIGIGKKNVNIKLNGAAVELSSEKYLTYPIEYEISNSDTINYLDKYGLKQGEWIFKSDSSLDYSRAFAKDDNWIFQEFISYHDSLHVKNVSVNHEYKASSSNHFYENGLLKKSFTRNKNFYQQLNFYPNGILKSIRILGSDDYYYDKEYYESGKLFIETFPDNEEDLYQKYYYESGQLMALYYIHKEDDFDEPEYQWICYNEEGYEIDKSVLIEQGYIKRY